MTKAFDCALRLLARREHGRWELLTKLIRKGYPSDESKDALLECERLGLQSDARFVEAVCNARIRQGNGPVKIALELQAKQVDQDLIASTLDLHAENWESHALAVWQKKFKTQHESDFNELQKQQRFLLYRGFSRDTITQIFKKMSS